MKQGAHVNTEGEIWKLIELHASVAHGEDPTTWSSKDRDYLKTLIKTEDGSV
jgi:hypothetical protein